MRPLVRADSPGTVILYTRAREETTTRAVPAIRPCVALLEHPHCRRLVLNDYPLRPPLIELACRLLVWILSYGEVDPDHVIWRLRLELGALRRVDHVVWRRDDVLKAPGLLEVVVQGAEGLDLCHPAAEAIAGSVAGGS